MSEIKNESFAEIITSVNELDEDNNYTVARVIDNGRCVELHYDYGISELEFDIKKSEDCWSSIKCQKADWFDLDMKDDEVLAYLDKEFNEFFESKEEILDYEY